MKLCKRAVPYFLQHPAEGSWSLPISDCPVPRMQKMPSLMTSLRYLFQQDFCGAGTKDTRAPLLHNLWQEELTEPMYKPIRAVLLGNWHILQANKTLGDTARMWWGQRESTLETRSPLQEVFALLSNALDAATCATTRGKQIHQEGMSPSTLLKAPLMLAAL